MRDKPNRLRRFAAAVGRVWRGFMRRTRVETGTRNPQPRRHVEMFAEKHRRRPSFRYKI